MRSRTTLIIAVVSCFLIIGTMDYNDQVKMDNYYKEMKRIDIGNQKAYQACLTLVDSGELPEGYQCE